MSEINLNPNELRAASVKFREAGKTFQTTLEELDKVTGELKSKWSGASQQVFYKQYSEMRNYIEGFTTISENIAKEMQAMADHIEKIDV